MPKTLEAINERITAILGGRAKDDRELAKLRREQRRASTVDRRQKCAEVGQRVEQFIGSADQRVADINGHITTAVNAVRNLAKAVDEYNGDLAALREELVAAGVSRKSPTPPSPRDSYTGVNEKTLTAGGKTVTALETTAIVERTIRSARDPKAAVHTVKSPVGTVKHPEGPFWRHTEHNGTFTGQMSGADRGLRQITKAEWLAANWNMPLVDVADFAPEVIDELTAQERARLAEQLLPNEEDE